MTPELYEHICEICYGALQLEKAERVSFLDQACAGDESLREEVETMLSYKGWVEGFLTTSALEVAVDQAAEVLDVENTTLLFRDRQTNGATSYPAEILADSFAPGMTLGGRYMIEKELSEGGICAVFLARDQKLHNTPVVIKVLLNIWQQTRHRTWLEKKFKDEIAALARIDHPSVVRALDVGELPNGRSYLVMQYVSGVSLRAVMTPQGMKFERVAKLIRQMGQAVAAAHQQGVIHRDLKPENIMLQNAGDEEYVKLIDFGIATVYEMADPGDNRTTEVIGTRSYVAPEQLVGKPVPTSDIFALGVIAYEMITGMRPFHHETIVELYELQRAGVKIKPCDLCPALPQAAQSMILKALSFAPQDRFPNAKDFTDGLADILMGKEGQRLVPPRRFIIPKPWLLLVTLVVLALIGAQIWQGFNFRAETASKKTGPPTIKAMERHLTYTMEAQRDPKRYPKSKPFAAFDNAILGAGDQVRFYISSSQSGSLYVLNEGPKKSDGFPDFNVLFPDVETNGGSPEIRAGQEVQIPLPSGNWFVFDKEEGVEKIWIIWSERAVQKLEEVKGWANPKDDGAIADPAQRALIAEYLATLPTVEIAVNKEPTSKRTTLKAKGEILVWMMELVHH